jgi:curved DNA-binding protein
MDVKDYYQILEVSKNATKAEINSAFRKLARKYHPDVNPGDPSAEERFKEINEAHEVLADEEKRKKYDRFGAQWQQYERAGGRPDDFDWSQWASDGSPSGGARTYTRSVSPEEFEQIFGSQGGAGFSDFFETLFGGRRGSPGAGFDSRAYQPRPRQGRDFEHPVQVTLAEAFHGVTRSLQFEDGRVIEAKIPPGVRNGSRVRLSGMAEPGSYGGKSGDLYLKVEVLPDKKFQREGNNLRINLPVDVFTLLLGGTVDCPSIDKTVKLTIPRGTANGKVFRLRGLGMPKLRNAKERGDLYATVEAKLPQNLTEAEIDLLKKWQQLRSG